MPRFGRTSTTTPPPRAASESPRARKNLAVLAPTMSRSTAMWVAAPTSPQWEAPKAWPPQAKSRQPRVETRTPCSSKPSTAAEYPAPDPSTWQSSAENTHRTKGPCAWQGPSSSRLYSPECVEGYFCEVGPPLYGVVGSSSFRKVKRGAKV